MPHPQLVGRTAVVTGGTRGIGLAIAQSLASEGADVVICGRSAGEPSHLTEPDAQSTRTDRLGRIESYVGDVRDPVQMDALMARAAEIFGRLDIVINNAGVGRFGHVAELSAEDWREVVETNLNGVFFSSRAAIPFLRSSGGGWIINIGSLAGSHPFVGGSAYCASKAGLNALSEILMQEVRHDDIRVSCVAPGSVETKFGGAHEGARTDWKLAPEDVARVVMDLLTHDPRSLPSRIEIRPSRPKK